MRRQLLRFWCKVLYWGHAYYLLDSYEEAYPTYVVNHSYWRCARCHHERSFLDRVNDA